MKELRIADIATITNGYAFKSEQFNSDGIGLPIIRIRDVQGGTSKTYYLGEYSDEYLVKNGDILIGMDGEFNINTWKSGKALLNQRVCKIAAKAEIADNTFLRYRLSLLLKQIEADTPFVTVKHLSSNDLQEQRINVPPIAEQKRIAAICAKADRLRCTRRYALELSDTYLRSVFLEMFGDLVANSNGWKFLSLHELADIASGVTKGQKFNGKATVTVPYLRVANVQDGYLNLSEIKNIEALPSEVEQLTLIKGDVLMTEGGDFDKLGRGTIWHGQIKNCIHQNHIFRVRTNRDLLLPDFFANFLRSKAAKLYFLSCSKQTTNLASINMTQLKSLPVPIPPLPLQEKFAAIVQKSNRIRAQQRESLRQAEHLFQTVLHRAFRGEL